jgi:MFS family permease
VAVGAGGEETGDGGATADAATAHGPHERRSVAALITSTVCSATATLAGTTALGKQVYDLTDRELALGLLGLAEFAPAALLVLVTGTVADRFDRRRVAATGAAGAALSAAALAVYAASDRTDVGPIFAIVVLFGIARAFIAPASRSLPADIVAPARMPWLVARSSASFQGAFIAGPLVGGFLYAVDDTLPYVAMAVLLAASAGAVLLVREHPTAVAARADARDRGAMPARPGLRDALEGLRFIRGQPVLLGAISLDLFAVLFGGAVALLPAIAEDRLGVGAVGLGWLRAAAGIGGALTAITLARRPVRRHVGRVLLVVVAVFGVGTIALGATHSFAVAFVAMAVLSGADAVSVFIRVTLVPLVTPPERRGRVLAVENVFIGASNELGAFESGVAGELLGPAGAVVLGGIATIAIAGLWWWRFPALRDVDRFPGGGLDVEGARPA